MLELHAWPDDTVLPTIHRPFGHSRGTAHAIRVAAMGGAGFTYAIDGAVRGGVRLVNAFWPEPPTTPGGGLQVMAWRYDGFEAGHHAPPAAP